MRNGVPEQGDGDLIVDFEAMGSRWIWTMMRADGEYRVRSYETYATKEDAMNNVARFLVDMSNEIGDLV